MGTLLLLFFIVIGHVAWRMDISRRRTWLYLTALAMLPLVYVASESFVQNVSRNISASGQLTWNTPVDGLSFTGKAGVNYWTKYDKAYRADTYFDDSKTVGPATLNVWTCLLYTSRCV